jgi:hypothetical protein
MSRHCNNSLLMRVGQSPLGAFLLVWERLPSSEKQSPPLNSLQQQIGYGMDEKSITSPTPFSGGHLNLKFLPTLQERDGASRLLSHLCNGSYFGV